MQLSIITVCLNEAKTIEKTLQSVINQTWQDFEWIVIDGASTDGTREIIEKYKKRIDIFISENDSGIYNAMNKGIKLAKGEYIYFLNGGDELFKNTTLEKLFGHQLNKDLIYGNIIIRDKNNYLQLTMPEILTKEFVYNKTIPHQSTFTKKCLFNKIGFYNEQYKIAADFDFSLNAIIKHKIKTHYIPLNIAVYDNKGISSNSEKREKEKKQIRKKYFNIWMRFYLIFLSKNLFIDLKPIHL